MQVAIHNEETSHSPLLCRHAAEPNLHGSPQVMSPPSNSPDRISSAMEWDLTPSLSIRWTVASPVCVHCGRV